MGNTPQNRLYLLNIGNVWVRACSRCLFIMKAVFIFRVSNVGFSMGQYRKGTLCKADTHLVRRVSVDYGIVKFRIFLENGYQKVHVCIWMTDFATSTYTQCKSRNLSICPSAKSLTHSSVPRNLPPGDSTCERTITK